jgi:hypothetical protein
MTGAAGLAGYFAGKPHPRRAAQPKPAGAARWVKRGLALGRSPPGRFAPKAAGESGAATAADVGVAVREVAGQHLQLRNLVTGVLSNLG